MSGASIMETTGGLCVCVCVSTRISVSTEMYWGEEILHDGILETDDFFFIRVFLCSVE